MVKENLLNFRKKYFKLHEFIRFAINGALLITIWFVFYKIFRDKWFIDYFYEEATFWFTNYSIYLSKIFLNILGYEIEIYGKIIKIIDSAGILLDRGCLGRNNMGLFAGFLLAYPGNYKTKIWYIPFGIFIFFLINTIRIVALVITSNCCPENLDFNHHILFKYIIWAIMFILWIIWVKFLRTRRIK